MNIHERLEAFWSGEQPDMIPYTIYQNEWRHAKDDPAWIPMFEQGLGVTWHIPSYKLLEKGIEHKTETTNQNGKVLQKKIISTEVGEIYSTYLDGWCQKYWLETPEDYKVMTYVVKHTEVLPDYENFLRRQQEIMPYGVALAPTGRTPMQVILVDYVGLENFSYHLVDYEDELMELYYALLDNYRKIVEIVANGPGRFVSVLENFTAETMGPARFEKYHMPVYNELFPVLQSSGKIVGTHYDGQLSSCSKLIAKAPIDLIESLTPPPEGDMTLDVCREIWPEKLFWSNINVSAYNLPKDELKQLVCDRIKQCAPDGRRLAFEVSEHIPVNWKTSMPIVLEALREMKFY